MITIDLGGRLGNQLFQYTVARLLAEQIKFHLATEYNWNDTITATPVRKGKQYPDHKIVIQETVDTPKEVKAETKAVHIPMPALGPSLGVAPSGTCT